MFQQLKDWAGFLRDLGLIIGMPTIMVVGIQLYELQLNALEQQKAVVEERNKLLKETQYDRALSIIRAQKELFVLEREQLEMQLAAARQTAEQDREKIVGLERQLSELESARKVFETFKFEPTAEGGIIITTPATTIGVRG